MQPSPFNFSDQDDFDSMVDSAGIAASLAVIDLLKVQLSDIARDVETSVNGVCAGFQGMSARARTALSAATETLNTSGEGGGLPAFVHRVRMALVVLLHRVRTANEFSSEMSDRINRMHDQLRSVYALGEKINATSNRTFGATRDSGESSLLSTRERVRLLAETSAESSREICELVSQICADMKDVGNRVQVRLAEDNEATGNSESTVRSILDRLAASYAQMSESLNKSAAMGRQLNSDIAQSVVSMQFQDRVNQRIDHIIESLDEIANQLRPHSRSANAEAAAEQTQAVMDRLAKSYTMDAERALAGEPSASQAAEGSIELF